MINCEHSLANTIDSIESMNPFTHIRVPHFLFNKSTSL